MDYFRRVWRLRDHQPDLRSLEKEANLVDEFAAEAHEQTHVHTGLRWVHASYDKVVRPLCDPVNVVEQWVWNPAQATTVLHH